MLVQVELPAEAMLRLECRYRAPSYYASTPALYEQDAHLPGSGLKRPTRRAAAENGKPSPPRSRSFVAVRWVGDARRVN